MLSYTAFDIEIANDFPPEGEPMDYAALGISCASIASRHSDGEILYKTWTAAGMAMTSEEARTLVTDLWSLEQEGQTLLTVNGAGFDFRVLAAASGLQKACTEMALNHVDLCFMMLAQRGFPLGLDAMAKGANVKGKLHKLRLSDGTLIEDMSGEMAPEMWRAGEREAVLAYLKDDVRSTLETGEAVERRRGISWIARSGNPNHQSFAKLLTVSECLAIPEPDTSWMSDPFTREKFIGWTEILEDSDS